MPSVRRFLVGNSIALVLGAAALAVGQQPAAGPAQPAADQTDEASPIERLLREGVVEVRYYDPREKPREFPGWSEFNYEVRHKYTYEYEERKRGRVNHVTLHVKVAPLEFSKRHIVHLPKALEQAKPWTDALARHELDHVAISADPRVDLLLTHLHRNLTRLERDYDVGQKIDDALLQKAIEDELTARRKAVIALVGAHYRLLDRLTRHGADELPQRNEFFAWLYTKPCLDQAEFAYTGEVLELLKSDAYQESAAIYLTPDEESKP